MYISGCTRQGKSMWPAMVLNRGDRFRFSRLVQGDWFYSTSGYGLAIHLSRRRIRRACLRPTPVFKLHTLEEVPQHLVVTLAEVLVTRLAEERA